MKTMITDAVRLYPSQRRLDGGSVLADAACAKHRKKLVFVDLRSGEMLCGRCRDALTSSGFVKCCAVVSKVGVV